MQLGINIRHLIATYLPIREYTLLASTSSKFRAELQSPELEQKLFAQECLTQNASSLYYFNDLLICSYLEKKPDEDKLASPVWRQLFLESQEIRQNWAVAG